MDLINSDQGWYFYIFGGEYDCCTSQMFRTRKEAMTAKKNSDCEFSYKPELVKKIKKKNGKTG